MLFNSLEFAVFLPVVFFIYWFVTNHNLRLQNLWVVAASFFFYGWWDWRFLFLLVFSASVDFFAGLGLEATQNPRRRKLLLLLSICTNLGILGFFKYFNFFSDNFASAFRFFGYSLDPFSLKIILPLGVSFYTFQALSYSIDIYKGKLHATRDPIAYFAFISFFPQLVAGPIERATNLLPQFFRKRTFDYEQAVDGCRQILWGLFKKIVIADNCAAVVNDIFNHHASYSGSTLFVGAVLFAFQIYGDFSGYSDVAVGTARLFGFSLMRNFAFPYFSRDIAEFWRRWHISLSTWFRDYVYIPLGGSRGGRSNQIRAIFALFLLSGFWHGANWTFIAWGLVNALYFLPLLLLGQNRKHLDIAAQGRWLPSWREAMQIGSTFCLTCLAWVFFRAANLTEALAILGQIFSPSLFTLPQVLPRTLGILLIFFLLLEWLQRTKQHALQIDQLRVPAPLKWAGYYFLVFIILYYGGKQQAFIYFQF